MSYDLAVWEGERPESDLAAATEFERLRHRYLESDEPVTPTARVAAYVTALLERFPDIDTDAGGDSPWSTGSLMESARGPLVYFPMVWSRSADVSAWAANLADEHQLHCYDPQLEQLRTPCGRPWRFELTSAGGSSYRDPDPDLVRRVVTRLSGDDFFAVLIRSDDWYVQVGYGERAGTRPGWYALERQDGTPDEHYRAEVTNSEEVVRAFEGFLRDDPDLPRRFPWQHYAL
ncbi:hypothetical protein AB0M36_24325 [Actinoplanes sp. NPDC051346]|uniref:hypothetical protein n=1 Tax=Actinoplanes sp. NPDC051346 TaxID=3155048 RepID=UPI003435F0D9